MNNEHVLSKHKTAEVTEVVFICGTCSHNFYDEDDYNKHVKIHDKPKETTHTNNEVLIEDVLDDKDTDISGNVLTLDELPETIPKSGRNKLSDNSSPFNQEKSVDHFNCNQCSFIFTCPVDLNAHMVTHQKKSMAHSMESVNLLPTEIVIEKP